MINFFTIDSHGTLTYANINDSRHSQRLVVGNNVWTAYPEEIGTVFHHASMKAIRQKEKVFLETYYASDNTWWEKHIYPTADGLAVYSKDITELKRLRDELQLNQANLSATINNTEVLIWSLDADLKLISFNKSFVNYILKYYGFDPHDHPSFIRDTLNFDTSDNCQETWIKTYQHVLAGETITFENSRFGRDYYYSLSPIIEKGIVIGVSAFAHNVTQRNKRERELQKAKKRIDDLKRATLRSAMDSHFIFSTLNSIQDYIIDNDRESAVNYLASFSKLIRSVLDSTLTDRTMLSDEIELIKNYVKLEQMRMGNHPFSFEVNIGEDVDLTTEIPPMIIQPFIENAIVHGLRHDDGSNGQIVLTIEMLDTQLVIAIDDNGVGRAAVPVPKGHRSRHRSHSTRVTEERLQLMNTDNPVSVRIEDKTTGGTRVVISIPSEYAESLELNEYV